MCLLGKFHKAAIENSFLEVRLSIRSLIPIGQIHL